MSLGLAGRGLHAVPSSHVRPIDNNINSVVKKYKYII